MHPTIDKHSKCGKCSSIPNFITFSKGHGSLSSMSYAVSV